MIEFKKYINQMIEKSKYILFMIDKSHSIILPTAVQEHITLTVQQVQVMLIRLIRLLVRVSMIN